MTSKFSTLSATAKTILAAAILGATLFVSSGAQAASNNFRGSFQIDLGNGVTFGINSNSHRYNSNRGHRRACLNNRQAIGGLNRMGYRNVKIIGGNSRFVKVRTRRQNKRYVIRVNKCSGKVAVQSVKRIQNGYKNKNIRRHNGRITLHY